MAKERESTREKPKYVTELPRGAPVISPHNINFSNPEQVAEVARVGKPLVRKVREYNLGRK